MDLRQLRSFIAVAEELHFGHAAERLGLAPTALSRIIRSLEGELGVSLLARTTRQVLLTRAGLLLLDEARGIIARSERVAQNVRDAAISGGKVLRIGAIDAASASFLPGLLHTYRREHPGVEIRFVEAMTLPQLQMLESGKLDIALIRPPRRAADIGFEVLRVERPVVLLPFDHPLAVRSHLSIADLVGEPFLVPSRRIRPFAYDLVMAYFEAAGSVPNVTQETTEKPAMIAAVAAGIGLALVPDWVASFTGSQVVAKRLVGQLLDPPPPGAIVGVAWRVHQKSALRDDFITLLRREVALMDEQNHVDDLAYRHVIETHRLKRPA